MKRFLRNLLILIAPFLMMIVINEMVRPKIKEKPYAAFGVTTINSADYLKEKCTWACHNDTFFCQNYHVKYLKPYYKITNLFYYGVIGLLALSGSYGAANIFFLVFLIPYTILYFFIKALDFKLEIKKLTQQN